MINKMFEYFGVKKQIKHVGGGGWGATIYHPLPEFTPSKAWELLNLVGGKTNDWLSWKIQPLQICACLPNGDEIFGYGEDNLNAFADLIIKLDWTDLEKEQIKNILEG